MLKKPVNVHKNLQKLSRLFLCFTRKHSAETKKARGSIPRKQRKPAEAFTFFVFNVNLVIWRSLLGKFERITKRLGSNFFLCSGGHRKLFMIMERWSTRLGTLFVVTWVPYSGTAPLPSDFDYGPWSLQKRNKVNNYYCVLLCAHRIFHTSKLIFFLIIPVLFS